MSGVAQLDPECRTFQSQHVDAFIQRNAGGIADLQARGARRRRVDPLPASRALSGLVGGLAYRSLVPGAVADIGFETLVSTVTRLWANVLQFGLV